MSYLANQRLLNMIDGNVMAYYADRAERVICTCARCECQVTEEQELCDKCKALEIGE